MHCSEASKAAVSSSLGFFPLRVRASANSLLVTLGALSVSAASLALNLAMLSSVVALDMPVTSLAQSDAAMVAAR